MSYTDLSKPFFVLAPMDDVTDMVFRQVVASTAAPDLFFTEFVNVDGLMSIGREHLLKKLRFAANEGRVVVQLWGLKPENFRAVAEQICDGTLYEELGIPLCPVHHSSSSGAFSPRSAEGAVQMVPRVSTGEEKGARAEKIGSASGSARRQDDRCVCGFVGVDLNMGCPAKSEVHSGACAALIRPESRGLAEEIIAATREGLAGRLPLSVKTRVGFTEVDMTWFDFLLRQDLDMLTVHGRTRTQMSKVPADWNLIGRVRQMRDELGVKTLIVGNGDVLSRQQGEELAEQHKLDGIMIGRGVFHDPFVFLEDGPIKWAAYDKAMRLDLYRRHVELFAATWLEGERPVHTLNKFCKIYVNGFDGAKEMREQLMVATSIEQLRHTLQVLMG